MSPELISIIGTSDSVRCIFSVDQKEAEIATPFGTNMKKLVRRFSLQKIGLAPLLKNTYRTMLQTRSADVNAEDRSGLIASARWTSLRHSGAGGVDVTGAPGSWPLVEGISGKPPGDARVVGSEILFKVPGRGGLLRWTILGSSLSTSTIVPEGRLHSALRTPPLSQIPVRKSTVFSKPSPASTGTSTPDFFPEEKGTPRACPRITPCG